MSALPVQVAVTIVPIACGECGLHFGIDSTYLDRLKEKHETFYCPKGHSRWFPPGSSDNEKLQKQLEAKERAAELERQKFERERRLREHYKRSAQTYRGHLTRVRKRVGNGVCPCCGRTFKQLAEHMQSKHPEYGKPVERVK